MQKKIEKWQEPPPAKQIKVLPAPDAEIKKRRGGRRARKYKERYGLTDTKKARRPAPAPTAACLTCRPCSEARGVWRGRALPGCTGAAPAAALVPHSDAASSTTCAGGPPQFTVQGMFCSWKLA